MLGMQGLSIIVKVGPRVLQALSLPIQDMDQAWSVSVGEHGPQHV